MKPTRKIKAKEIKYIVIWDKDDVLVEKHLPLLEWFNAALKHVEGEHYKPFSHDFATGTSAKTIFQQRYVNEHQTEEAYRYFCYLREEGFLKIPPMEGALDSLRYFSKQPTIQGVCTNDLQTFLDKYALRHQLTQFIDPELMIGNIPGSTVGKPGTDTMEILLERVRKHCKLSDAVLKDMPIFMVDDEQPAVEMVQTMRKRGYKNFSNIVFGTKSLHGIANHVVPVKIPNNTDQGMREALELMQLHKLYLTQNPEFLLISDHNELQTFFKFRQSTLPSFFSHVTR